MNKVSIIMNNACFASGGIGGMKRAVTALIILHLAGGSLCAVSTGSPAGEQAKTRHYDVAAYVWPAYQFKDERWNQIFKQGIGEWEIIRECKPGFPVGRGPTY